MQTSRSLSTMRALVLRGGAPEFCPIPRPSPRDGQLLVRVTHALVTPFEREVVRGLRAAERAPMDPASTDPGQVLGCSFIGVVEDVGRASQPAPHRGTRVAVQPVISCGLCDRCDSGLAIHCAARSIAGLDAPIGGLAEFAAVPVANAIPIADRLDDERAVFAVALARAMEAIRRGGIEGRSFVSVLGDDVFALLAALVGREENPLTRLVSPSQHALELATQYGLRNRALSETGRRGDQELVIDMTGSAESAAAAARMVRPRGHVVFGGISARAPVGVDLSHLALDEIEVIGSGFAGLDSALDWLARGAIDPAPLVSRRVGLADAAKSIALVGEPGVASVIVQVNR